MATTEDTDAEADETFTVSLAVSGTTLPVTANDTAEGTITNDDVPAVTIEDASADEGDRISFTVTLNTAVSGGLTVTPSFTDVTATKGTDYTANTAALSFTGMEGEQKTFTVATTEDEVVEADETFTVGLAVSGTSETVTATGTATGTISNDDSAAVTIDDAVAIEGETLTFTVKLDNAVQDGLTVTPSLTDVTATKGTDYDGDAAALTFAGTADETQTFTLDTVADEDTEDAETFTVSLTLSSAPPAVTASDTATGTIADEGVVVVTIDDASATEGDLLIFTVKLNQAVKDGLTVTPSFTDVTATKGTDYTENTAALTFLGNPGETQTLTVSTTEDTAVEANETFTVGLTVSDASVIVIATDTAKGTITNNDGALAAVTIEDVSAAEGDDLTFTVKLNQAVKDGLKVTPGFTDGTATEGIDYTANTSALIFAGTAGETQSFTVTTTEDTAVETDETFTVSLAVSGTSATVDASDTATGTITNDDDPEVTIDDASANEGDSITFKVTLDKAVAGGLKVTPAFTDVTATKGTDYTENTTALTFAGTEGETQSFTVTTTEDTDKEHHETFTVSLAVSETSVTVTASDTATGTITDDDGALAAVTIENVSAAEGDDLTFTVTLDNAVTGGLKVTPSFTDVTATEGTDYTENTDALTFTGAAGETQSFTVTTTQDTAVEADETFTVSLAVSESTATVTASDTATGTITNDDGGATVTIADAAADEGDSITFTVTLDKAVAGGLKVTPAFTDVTATKGTDYTENTTALTFAGTEGETQSFTVTTTEDTDKEHHETFTVSLAVSGTSVTVTASDTATGTITDDDGALAAVTIENVSAAEGDDLRFTVTLDNAVTGGLKVTPSFTDVTATEGTDYTENTDALTFTGAAGETQSFTVTTTEDAAVEADETFTVSLAVSDATATVTASDTATGTITNDDGSAAVTIADASANEGEAITFTVTLDKAVAGGLKVTPSFTDVTATKGTDYTENTTALTFTGAAGETQSFTVTTTEDTDKEHHETFTVSLAVSETSATVTATDTATGTITDDDGALAAVTIEDVSAEEGDDLTFTVTLDNAVSGGLKVTPSFTDVTATKGTDYTENTTALTFAGTAGETQSFTVSTTRDTDAEADETFTVSLAVSDATATVTATDTATGTITNDDSAAVTIADASADEGEAITFTVTLDKAVAGGLKVTPSFTDVTATKGTDYTENTSALTFVGTAGETQSFTVSTTEDTAKEHHETFTVSLAVSGTSVTVTASDTATGTITDDDGALAAVTIENVSAAEGDSLTFTVTLDNAVSGGLKVTPSFTDVTGTKGTDYTENTSALTFTGTAGETQSFTVTTTEDAAVEADETFTVSLAVSDATATVTASDTATGTITNDDGSAAVTIADASANEGEAITFTVTLDKAVAGGLTVTPSFTDVTATKGTDYTENTTALTFTGTAGETQNFTVTTTEDAAVEADETFTVSLAVTESTATVTASDTATGTITNDDGGAEVTIGDASAEEGDSLTFTVTLDKAVSGGLKVTPSFTDVTATKGTDYTENTAALTFAGTAGETQSFTVATTEDTDKEHHETFTVGLTVSGTTAEVTASDTATGTITDDDGALAAVTIENVSAAEGDDLTFTVTLDNAVSGGLKVTPSFTDVTATKGTDYTENTTALTFAGTAGETQSFTVTTTEDTAVEADETFTVGLAVSEATAEVTASDTATGTITNDDGGAEVTIGDASADEGETITFTVTLDKAVSGGLKVTPSFTDVTATEGTDYTENTAELTFAGNAGETQTFTVTTTEDTAKEHHETFTVSLAVSDATAEVTASDTATGTITDDDGALAAVTIENVSANEGDSLTFTVTLDKAVTGGLKVTPSFTDVTATKGTDYTENTAALTFSGTAGETQSFTVTTTEDSAVEADETFTVSLAVSDATATVTSSDTATGTITNDDGGAAVTIGDASADEGEAITFTVTLDKAVAGGLTVTPSFTDVTATKGTDYTENTAALTFAGTEGETQSFTVATREDTAKEHHETFTVSLAVTGTSATVTATDTATGTITDDDGALAAVTIENVSAEEGDDLTFTVTLDNAVSGGLKVTPSFTDVTATKGTDYTENTSALTFAGNAGETQSFTVTTTEDAAVEAAETFTVSLAVSDATATVTASDTATGTITNDDGSAAVTIADASAEEGETITFTVTLDKAVSGGLKVTPSFTDVTATKGTDYTENTSALTFAGTAGETQSFTVATTEDTAKEHHETFTVSLAVSETSATVTATDTATGTITDDDGALAAVTIDNVSAEEGDDLTFTVTLDNAVTGGLKVTPSFTDVTATEGTDYTENTTALTFSGTAGETQSFTVTTTEDSAVEADETFTVSLAVSEATATVTASDTATGTITNDDGSAAVTIADASAEEGETITFTVTLDKVVSGGLKVTPSFTDVTATKGTDYTENTTALTFSGTAGETQSFTVTTREDTAKEHHETFTVSLAVSGTSAAVTATDTATGTITDDDGALAAVTIADASAEEGETITFTVTLDNAISGGLKVTPSFTDVTATKGTDYTENTSALTFAGTAGETQSFTVATIEDTDDEEDAETFTVSLTVSGTSATVTATDTATGTIHQTLIKSPPGDDPAVTIADASANEGDSITFTVTLDKAVTGGLTVTPSFTDVTATKGTDYTENTGALKFTGTVGETQSFTVTTEEDSAVEDDETFTVGLAVSGTTATVTASDTATGTITDDDHERSGNTPAVTVADASADEGDSITFTVTLDKAVTGGLTVTPSFTDGTATKGTDYTENTEALTFAGTTGETQTFTVATIEDTDDETNETFTVSLTVSGNSETVAANDTATGTILDDDGNAPPVITAPDDRTYEQGETITPFGITVTDADGESLTVTVTGLPSGLSYANDQVQGTVAADAAAKAYTVTISADDGVNTAVTGTFTITVTEAAAQVTVADASAGEGDPITFTVTLNRAVSGGLTVTPSFTDGTAEKGADYTENTAALTFAGTAGETQTFTVETVEDDAVEDDETFTVSLSVSDAPPEVTVGGPATGIIEDDDDTTGDTVYVSIHDPESPVIEGSSVQLPVSLTSPAAGAVQVPWTSTANSGSAPAPKADDGTGQSLHEHEPSSGTVTFEAGQTEATIEINILDDEDHEDLESFQVALDEPSVADEESRQVSVRRRTAMVTIMDNDAPPVFNEGDAAVRTVVENTPPDTNIGEPIAATDAEDDPLAYALVGDDASAFTLDPVTGQLKTSESLDFEVKSVYESLTVTVDDGHGHTDTLSLTVNVTDVPPPDASDAPAVTRSPSAPTSALDVSWTAPADNGAPITDYDVRYRGTGEEEWKDHAFEGTGTGATITGLTEDSTYEVQVLARSVEGPGEWSDSGSGSTLDPSESRTAVTITNARADEGDSMTFTVTLNRVVEGGLTVTPGFSDVTATVNRDYTPNTAALRFAGTLGERQTFRVLTIEDAVVEADETFTVSLGVSDAPSGVTVGGPATGTIEDDDGALASVTISNADALEGDSMTFTVTLNRTVPGGLTVTPRYTDVTATADSDYTPNTAALRFAGTLGEQRTFTVETIEDAEAEDDETFRVRLDMSDAPAGVTAGRSATGTINDDDGGGIGGRRGANNAPSAMDDYITVSQGDTATTLANGNSAAQLKNLAEDPFGASEDLLDDLDGSGDERGYFAILLETSVLANDSDLEDDISQLSVQLVDDVSHGDLTLNSDGTFVYAHDGGEAVEDRFTYRVKDSGGVLSEVAKVTISILGANSGPEAETIPDQILLLGKDGTVDLSSYFTDPDGDPLSYRARATDGSSTVRVNVSSSEVILTPVAVNATRVTVTARDPGGLSIEQTFGVTVESVAGRNDRLL